jgi:hypothetical protein
MPTNDSARRNFRIDASQVHGKSLMHLFFRHNCSIIRIIICLLQSKFYPVKYYLFENKIRELVRK